MKYEGNETVKKIIDSGFTCEGLSCEKYCNVCPFNTLCKASDKPEKTRKKIIEFIVDEIVHNGFDIDGRWIESKAMEILCYYTVEPELWKSISAFYDQKYDKTWSERLQKLNVKNTEQPRDNRKKICSSCGKECLGMFVARNPDVLWTDAVCVSECCRAEIKYISNAEKPAQQNKFYVFNQQGQTPTRIHDSYESALEEAKRLSKKYYNSSVVVCQIKAIIKQEITTIVEEV